MRKEFDIVQHNPDVINISEIGSEGKFADFKKYVNEKDPTDIKIVNESRFEFTSNELKKEKISFEEKLKSFQLILSSLRKHIDEEVRIELLKIEHEITEKIKSKYNFNILYSKLKILEVSQVSMEKLD